MYLLFFSNQLIDIEVTYIFPSTQSTSYTKYFFSLEKVKHEGIDNSLDEFFIQYRLYIYVYTTFVHITMGQKKILKRFIFIICFIFFFVPGGDPVLLSGGIHSFPFKLGLPLGLPSTFLGKHGWVQYFCKAALREESGLTHKNQQVFIIMNPIDLNLEPPILAVRFIMHFFKN